MLGERRFSISAETPLVFVHAFKCAGTSVHEYLSGVFPGEAIYPGRHARAFDTIVPGYLVYSGHMTLRQWDRAPVSPHFVFWARHPVARTVSAYYFLAGLTESYITNSRNRDWLDVVRRQSFPEFLRSEAEPVRRRTWNTMSRALCPRAAWEESAWWRLGWHARAALKRFAYIGIAERTDACLVRLARRFGLPPPSRHFRSNSYVENAMRSGHDVAAAQPATPEILAAIRRGSRADLWLYRKAVALSARMR